MDIPRETPIPRQKRIQARSRPMSLPSHMSRRDREIGQTSVLHLLCLLNSPNTRLVSHMDVSL